MKRPVNKRLVVGSAFSLSLLVGCTGDERPFLEAVEVERLGVRSLEIVRAAAAPQPFSVGVGESVSLGLAARGEGGASSDEIELSGDDRDWRVADPGVLTVSRDGVLRGVADGSTEVIVRVGNIVSEPLAVDVSSGALLSIQSIEGPDMPDACRPTRYVAVGAFEGGSSRLLSDVEWDAGVGASRRDPEASDLAAGATRLVPGEFGQTALTATVGGLVETRALTVPDTLSSLTLPTGLQTLRRNGTLQLDATARYTRDEETEDVVVTDGVEWSVQSGDSVTVGNEAPDRGLVRAQGTGDAVVQARCGNVTPATVRIGVGSSGGDEDDDGLAFQQGTTLRLNIGGPPVRLRVSTGADYEEEEDVTEAVEFRSDNVNVASVLSGALDNGLLTPGQVAGDAIITAIRGTESAVLRVTVQ